MRPKRRERGGGFQALFLSARFLFLSFLVVNGQQENLHAEAARKSVAAYWGLGAGARSRLSGAVPSGSSCGRRHFLNPAGAAPGCRSQGPVLCRVEPQRSEQPLDSQLIDAPCSAGSSLCLELLHPNPPALSFDIAVDDYEHLSTLVPSRWKPPAHTRPRCPTAGSRRARSP